MPSDPRHRGRDSDPHAFDLVPTILGGDGRWHEADLAELPEWAIVIHDYRRNLANGTGG